MSICFKPNYSLRIVGIIYFKLSLQTVRNKKKTFCFPFSKAYICDTDKFFLNISFFYISLSFFKNFNDKRTYSRYYTAEF